MTDFAKELEITESKLVALHMYHKDIENLPAILTDFGHMLRTIEQETLAVELSLVDLRNLETPWYISPQDHS